MRVQTPSIKANPEFYQASRGDHERAFSDGAAPSRNAREIRRSLPVPLPLPDLGRRGCGAVAIGAVAEAADGDGCGDNVSPPGVGDRLVNCRSVGWKRPRIAQVGRSSIGRARGLPAASVGPARPRAATRTARGRSGSSASSAPPDRSRRTCRRARCTRRRESRRGYELAADGRGGGDRGRV